MTLKNPSEEIENPSKTAPPCIMVIFGATGDLTGRKLLPALYNLSLEGQLPTNFACVGFARREKDNEEFGNEMYKAINEHSRTKNSDPRLWESFKERIYYHRSEFDQDEGYLSLDKLLKELDEKHGTKGNRVFYLSTQPSYFPLIIEKLKQHNLIYSPEDQSKWSRVIIEKPFGHDLSSALALQKQISQSLDESQIYRIDHYLGKETVQNLLVLRFTNPIFESVWNNRYVDNVQITVSEDIGIGTRGHFFEEAGMLRDIVQNHMMQLLSLVAMEPPISMGASAIHSEKVKVMESIKPISQENLEHYAIRGQYGPGLVNGKTVAGYRQEPNVPPNSNVETYVALKLAIETWRWSGVPFYLRAGKRLPKRATEIVITFKEVPVHLFSNKSIKKNILVIRIQPDEGVSFTMNCKVPGINSPIQDVKMDFRYNQYFGMASPEAYERLLCDCMTGDSTLFARADEVLASWKLLTPVLDRWQQTSPSFPNYAAGSWGPKEADEMLIRDGREWYF